MIKTFPFSGLNFFTRIKCENKFLKSKFAGGSFDFDVQQEGNKWLLLRNKVLCEKV